MNYGFIGLGNMAGAIIRGMTESGSFGEDRIYGINRSAEKTRRLSESCGLIPCSSIGELSEKCGVIVLCVKPQMLSDVLPALNELPKGKTVLTIAAGKTLSWYEQRLPEGTPVVRVMPNMNARVGASVSAVCGSSSASGRDMDIAKRIFSSVGRVYEIEEKLFPAFSAVCGASGAFVLMYIDALSEVAVRAGFSRKTAEELSTAVVLGTAMLKQESTEHPIALMDSICSPGGTTIEGVLKLKELGFESAVHQGIQAIIDKDSRI